jgi:hypothetical protein
MGNNSSLAATCKNYSIEVVDGMFMSETSNRLSPLEDKENGLFDFARLVSDVMDKSNEELSAYNNSLERFKIRPRKLYRVHGWDEVERSCLLD